MCDICYYCDGTGVGDFISGAPCHECGGSGIREEEDEESEDEWDDGYPDWIESNEPENNKKCERKE